MYVAPFKAFVGLTTLIVMILIAPRWIGGVGAAYAAVILTVGLFIAIVIGLNTGRRPTDN